MFTLDQLTCFTAVYDTQSYSKAGKLLGKSRTTVRERINALEDSLGYELFEVTGKSAQATDLAHPLYPRAVNLVRQSQELERVALASYEVGLTNITLHHDDLIPLSLLINIDREILKAYPGVSINWLQRDRKTSFSDIENGNALFSIVPGLGNIYPSSNVGVLNLGTYTYSAYTSVVSDIPSQVNLSDLTLEALLITENAVIDEMRYTTFSNRSQTISSNDMLMEKLKYGGWTILSKSNAESYVQQGLIREIRINEVVTDLKQEMVLFYPLSAEKDPVKKSMLEIVEKCTKAFHVDG